jgi:hypothetical protein
MLTLTSLPTVAKRAFRSITILCLNLIFICCATSLLAQNASICTISATKSTICKGESTTLTPNCSGSIVWNNGKTNKQITVKPDATTTYSMVCTTANGSTKMGSITITVIPLPTAIIIAPNQSCPNVPIAISAENAGNGASYSWDFGASALPLTAKGIGPHQVRFSLCTPRTITMTVSKDGCTNPKQKTIRGDEVPPVLYGVPSDMTVSSLPPTPKVTAKDNCDKDVVVVFTENYVVDGCNRIGNCKWTATDKCGNTTTATMRLTITTLMTLATEVTSNYFPYSGYPSASGTNVSKIGASDGKANVIIASGGTSPFSFKWSNGETTQQATTLKAGTSYVTVTDANGCTGIASVKLKDPAKIGDYIFLDNNQNGIQDNTDTPLANVKVTLIGTDINGATVNFPTNSDPNGKYCFDGLIAGTYKIKVENPTGNVPTLKDQGNDDNVDSDIGADGFSPNVSVTNGQNINHLDAGFRLPIIKLGSLGDLVWEDINKNGVQDNGEIGIPNVTVLLDATLNDGTPFFQRSMATNANGIYTFFNLKPGVYCVTFSKPLGYIPSPANQGANNAKDSDANITTGKTGNINLNNGANNVNIDAGFYKDEAHTCVIGDFVWLDCNKNGIQDFGEFGIPNVLVQLKKQDGSIAAVTTTAVNGFYNFNNIPAGTYTLQFFFPASPYGLAFSPKDQGTDDSVDSDVKPNGSTDPIIITSQIVNTIDAGMMDVLPPTFANIPADLTVECDNIPAKATNVIATDNLDKNVTIDFIESRTAGICTYKIIRTWTGYDDCGNQCAHSQTITVVDSKAPTLVAPPDITINCGEATPPPSTLVATDNCDPAPIVTFVSDIAGILNGKNIITRTWQATDRCNNTTRVTQTICQADNVPPTFENLPIDLTVECNEVPSPQPPTVKDNCAITGVTIKYKQTKIDGDCIDRYLIKREWTAFDVAGNSATATQNIVVQDNTPPVISGAPTVDVTINCGDPVPPAPPVTASDNCDVTLTKPSFSELIFEGICSTIVGGQPVTTNHIRCQWLATDRCGNTAIKIWNIYIVGNNGGPSVSKTIQTSSNNQTIPLFNATIEENTSAIKPSEQIIVFPNPSQGVVYLNLNEQLVKEIQVLDVTGKIIYVENKIRNDNPSIDLSQQQLGIYTLRIKMYDGRWITRKVTLIE